MTSVKKAAIRLISLVLICVFVFSMFTACTKTQEKEPSDSASSEKTTAESYEEGTVENFNPTGYPIVKEKIKLKLMGKGVPNFLPDDWNEVVFFQKMEELTNISFEFDVLPDEAFEQRKGLAFASGDLPDLFFKAQLTDNEVAKYGKQGLLVRLNDLLDKYAVNFNQRAAQNPTIKTFSEDEAGNIYTLPYYYGRDVYPANHINTKWLENVGKKMPTNPDELYDVLKAFKEQDPNRNGEADEIPMTAFCVTNDMTRLTDLMQNFGIMFGGISGLFFVDNDEVKCTVILPEYKNTLIYFRKLFAEKLLDNDVFTQDMNQVKAKGEKYRLGVMNAWSGDELVGYDYNLEYSVIPPFVVNGQTYWHGFPGLQTGVFAITSANKYPEATIRWVDYLFTEEGAVLSHEGEEGVDWKWNDDGTWEKIEPASGAPKRWNTIQPGGRLVSYVAEEFNKKRKFDEHEKHKRKNLDMLLEYYREAYPSNIKYTESQVEEINKISADVRPYVDQMMARFITGDASIENEWDEYVSRLKNMGLDRLIEISKEVYKKYYGK